jgi:hypothetical protein
MTSIVGSCFSIFSFLCDCDYDRFSGVRVSQSLVFSVIVTMTSIVGSCFSIFSFLCDCDYDKYSGFVFLNL